MCFMLRKWLKVSWTMKSYYDRFLNILFLAAPAHEQHLIALHRHGHQLGGLPTLFWVSVCAIIIVFHIFLCKLIIKEYCEPSDKLRYRYNKP